MNPSKTLSEDIAKEWPEERLNKAKTKRLENLWLIKKEENEELAAAKALFEDEQIARQRESWFKTLQTA